MIYWVRTRSRVSAPAAFEAGGGVPIIGRHNAQNRGPFTVQNDTYDEDGNGALNSARPLGARGSISILWWLRQWSEIQTAGAAVTKAFRPFSLGRWPFLGFKFPELVL